MYTIIQDTWNEEDDQDLLNYIKDSRNNINYKILSKKEILNFNVKEIDVLFADTSIVQEIIGVNNIKIPKCYPDVFSVKEDYYKREIKVINARAINKFKFPYFIKPYSNDKSFEAHIVKNEADYEFLVTDLALNNVNDDDKIYYCELVNFINEYRLFIGDYKVSGIVESTDYIVSSSRAKMDIKPSNKFIDSILEINPYKNCVIDIGLIDNGDVKYWTIVEVNPAFALTSYNWDIDKYYNYCRNSWRYYTS